MMERMEVAEEEEEAWEEGGSIAEAARFTEGR